MNVIEIRKIKFVFSVIVFIEYVVALLLLGHGIYVIIPYIFFLCIYVTKVGVLEKMFVNLFFIVSMLVFFLTLKEFELLPQAKVLLDIDSNLFYWFSEGHIHAVRLLISYPGYLVSEWIGIELNEGFGFYCTVIFLLFYRNIIELIKTFVQNEKNAVAYYLISILVTTMLFLMMNGRIIFAFYGISLILLANMQLYNGIDISIKHIFMMAVGILLTMVSSGTLVVGTATVFMGIVFSNQIKEMIRKKWLWSIGILCVPVIFVFINYFIKMVNKNITFFGGGLHGVINMLQHGLGRYLHIDNIYAGIGFLLFGILIVILNALIILRLYQLKTRIFPIIVSFNISIYGSLFGISTGTTSIIGMILILFYCLDVVNSREKLVSKGFIDV